jgi:hypothetical protein
MKRIFQIAAIPVIILLFTAEQCGEAGENRRQDNILNSRKNEIISTFESGFLSDSSLFEHEKAAKQKLGDLADYLRILTDTSLQQPFRVKAAEIIRNTFISDSVVIELVFGPGESVRKMNIGSLILKGLDNKLPIYSCTFESIKVENSFFRFQEESYSATLGFVQVPVKNQHFDGLENSYPCKVIVLIGKEIRVFGSDSLSVWKMHFGNME